MFLIELGLSDAFVSYTAGNAVALGFEVVSMKTWFLEALVPQEPPAPQLPTGNLTYEFAWEPRLYFNNSY